MAKKQLPINENNICPGGTTISTGTLARMKEQVLEAGSDVDALADFFAAVGSPHRLRILLYLTEAEELCVCDFAELLDLNMTTVSAHLNKMKLQGILKTRRDAQMIYYSIADKERVSLLGSAFSGLRRAMSLSQARV
jgi:DNA-binding transcriptional ArsR family regulator